jgi:16S rRNA (cytidine1402-2'-O)-methyltransferase
MQKGTLFLIPTVLAEDTAHLVISPQIKEIIPHLEYFLVENIRTARRFVSSLKLGVNIDSLEFGQLDKSTSAKEIESLMEPLLTGKDIGLMSEAGCPGIADPGSLAVAYAHRKGIRVCPISGPSSMFLALMGSGFNGQSFAFHGYLPIQKKDRILALRALEAESRKMNRTQIFMETPFRNMQLFEDCIESLHPDTLLCIAKNLTGFDESILSKPITLWKKEKLELHKVPAVFVLYAGQV